MLPFLGKLFSKFQAPTANRTSVQSRQINNKTLDDVELALQRTLWNREMQGGKWQIHGGSALNLDKEREVIYQFTLDNQVIPLIALRLSMTSNPEGVLLSWTFKPQASEFLATSINKQDQLIIGVIEETEVTLERLINLAHVPFD